MNVMVLGKIHPSGLTLLRENSNFETVIVDPGDGNEIDKRIGDTAAILVRTSQISEALIARAPKLKVVSRFGVGFDNIDVAALTRRGIPLAVVGQDNAVAVAEQTLYLMLAAMKMGLTYDRAVRSGNWLYRDSMAATELAGKRVLIIGMGRIGRGVASLCQAFAMTVSFFDPLLETRELDPGWLRVDELLAGLSAADAVSVHVPLTDATRSLLGANEMAAMKRSAVLVSTSRGGIIDEAALARALAMGTIRAAGLDVFETEPVPEDNALLKLDNVILSPHMSALSYECAERMSITAAKNCLDGINGCLNPARVVNVEVLTS